MKTLIEGYRVFPGDHCGSSAMRGLLYHYHGLELPEPVIFGLGAGLDSLFLSLPEMKPASAIFGRTGTMEVDLTTHLDVEYDEQPEPDDAKAWEDVRREVLAGRPTMLSGDILYLDHREFRVNFPAHRFVLLGFDDEREKVLIADRLREDIEECSYSALAESRNPPVGLSTTNLWGRFGDTPARRGFDLVAASRRAIARCARRMLGDESGGPMRERSDGEVATGIEGTRRFAAALDEWRVRPDAAELAGYNSSVIERFGNGGGNFRRLYSGFLTWAREQDPAGVPAAAPELATRSADAWTALSGQLWEAREDAAAWTHAARLAHEIATLEAELFERLGEATPAH